ncbi:hypothetical protein GWI33_003736 [Rhynchophorus ferrugineus]|uniref:Uncharacterized protein n=1 Tax=Rhynchophorus ferrugineus TaxID=354439 RepID=A0A834HR68_RHYFE|nr:hypothetical protein GWI33_003736 [Rhynchophorus ferrugineus]
MCEGDAQVVVEEGRTSAEVLILLEVGFWRKGTGWGEGDGVVCPVGSISDGETSTSYDLFSLNYKFTHHWISSE